MKVIGSFVDDEYKIYDNIMDNRNEKDIDKKISKSIKFSYLLYFIFCIENEIVLTVTRFTDTKD